MPTPSPKPKGCVAAPPEAGGESDVGLVAGLNRGDRSALATLYDLHSAGVYTLARRILRCDAEAEAVVSDVFFEVWRRPDCFDTSRGSCRTYLMVLACSRALDRCRGRSRREELIADGGELAVARQVQLVADHQPVVRAIQSEKQEQVNHALGRLDTKHCQPLRLAYFEGLTHREIADRLGEPLGTIKTRIRAALLSLRSTLRTHGRDDDELP